MPKKLPLINITIRMPEELAKLLDIDVEAQREDGAKMNRSSLIQRIIARHYQFPFSRLPTPRKPPVPTFDWKCPRRYGIDELAAFYAKFTPHKRKKLLSHPQLADIAPLIVELHENGHL